MNFPASTPSPIAIALPQLRRSRQSKVVWGSRVVTVGGDAPVRVQSMTNTDTADAVATAIQVKELALAGSEMVRITVNTPEAAEAVPYIRDQLDRMGVDVWEVIDAAATKPFGYMRFTPGPGVGGHCLPIDPSYLSWQVERSLGQTFRFVELANKDYTFVAIDNTSNSNQPEEFLKLVRAENLPGK